MTRVDRVMDLLELLRSSDVLTTAEIADRLETSRRSVLRDLATLRARGWPIEAEAGPGGGVRLDRARGVTLVHIGVDEVVSLWLAAHLAASAASLPFGKATRSALRKLERSLPPDRARTLRELLRRIVIGRPASESVRVGLGTPSAELLTAFEHAFSSGLCLEFEYVDRLDAKTRRRVEPHGLLVEAPAWYLLARDADIQEPRMFRMDRIRRPRPMPERPFVPDLEGLHAQYLALDARRHGSDGRQPARRRGAR